MNSLSSTTFFHSLNHFILTPSSTLLSASSKSSIPLLQPRPSSRRPLATFSSLSLISSPSSSSSSSTRPNRYCNPNSYLHSAPSSSSSHTLLARSLQTESRSIRFRQDVEEVHSLAAHQPSGSAFPTPDGRIMFGDAQENDILMAANLPRTSPPDQAPLSASLSASRQAEPSPPTVKPKPSLVSATRTSRTSRPAKQVITLTPKAIEHLSRLLEGPTPKLIRVGVKKKGCAGMAYHLEYVDQPGKFDEVVFGQSESGRQVQVLIDSSALFSIIGSEMDWEESQLGDKFVFNNPNIKEQCGCGESFLV